MSVLPGLSNRYDFPATSWTILTQSMDLDPDLRAEALADLYCRYWAPVYALARQKGLDPVDAEDLTQEFFQMLFADQRLEGIDRRKGSSSWRENCRDERARVRRRIEGKGVTTAIVTATATATQGR